MHSELDAYDRRILALLQEDASLSSAQIAEQVGLSQSPCWRRIQRLKEEGVIRGQVTLLDRKKIGLNTQIFAEVKLNAHGRSNFTEFHRGDSRFFPEVLECYVLMGAVDFSAAYRHLGYRGVRAVLLREVVDGAGHPGGQLDCGAVGNQVHHQPASIALTGRASSRASPLPQEMWERACPR